MKTQTVKIEHDKKLEYLKVALAIAEIQATTPACDTIIQVYQKIEEKGGDVDLWDLSKIRADIQAKYKIKK
jgi:hypothetical protein